MAACGRPFSLPSVPGARPSTPSLSVYPVNRLYSTPMLSPRLLAFVATLALAPLASAATATFDLATANVADINAAFDAGALTSEKLLGLYLKRIEAYDKTGPKLNSVITLNPTALAEARALDAERKTKGPRSPLHGIPVVLKDLIDATGMPTTAGFTPFGKPMPPRDATIVARMKAAGAILSLIHI